MLRVEYEYASALDGIQKLLARLENPAPALNEIGENMANSTMERFSTGTAPDGSPWAENSPDPGFNESNFGFIEYTDSRGRQKPEYRLTHDGFALLAMGFTGRDALAWKIAFLQAFNALEAELHAKSERYAHALDQVRPMLRPVVEATEAGRSRAQLGRIARCPVVGYAWRQHRGGGHYR